VCMWCSCHACSFSRPGLRCSILSLLMVWPEQQPIERAALCGMHLGLPSTASCLNE
jgi:hypothetical protein